MIQECGSGDGAYNFLALLSKPAWEMLAGRVTGGLSNVFDRLAIKHTTVIGPHMHPPKALNVLSIDMSKVKKHAHIIHNGYIYTNNAQ